MRQVSSVPDWTGEEGEHLLYVSGTVRRLYFYDITNATWHYVEWNNSNLGSRTIVGTVSLTAQAGDIGATTIYTPAAAGIYKLSVYAICTTAGSAGTLTVTAGWTDDAAARTSNVVNGLDLTGTNAAENTLTIRSTATAITYATAIAGGAGSPAYALFIVLERLA